MRCRRRLANAGASLTPSRPSGRACPRLPLGDHRLVLGRTSASLTRDDGATRRHLLLVTVIMTRGPPGPAGLYRHSRRRRTSSSSAIAPHEPSRTRSGRGTWPATPPSCRGAGRFTIGVHGAPVPDGDGGSVHRCLAPRPVMGGNRRPRLSPRSAPPCSRPWQRVLAFCSTA